MEIATTRIDPHEMEIADLHHRLDNARWPDAIPGSGWDLGTDIVSLRHICERWRHGHDWLAHVDELNRYDQYRMRLDGAAIHVLHVPSPEPNAMPLVLLHGWPSTFSEFRHLIGPLTDPVAHGGDARDAFELIIPSLPGFGFSGPTTTRGWDGQRMARAIVEFCRRLGISRYGVYGGDVGAYVAECMGIFDRDSVVGVHMQLGGVRVAGVARADAALQVGITEREQQALADLSRFESKLSAYAFLNSTQPQTIAFALNDSPIGLASWIVEKFNSWTDCEGPDGTRDLTRAVDIDDVLNIVTTYWVTGTIGSASRFYAETRPAGAGDGLGRLEVPTGCAIFPGDIATTSQRWAANIFPNIVHWTEMPRGGHFAALEQPQLLAGDISAFFRTVGRGDAP